MDTVFKTMINISNTHHCVELKQKHIQLQTDTICDLVLAIIIAYDYISKTVFEILKKFNIE